MEKPTNLVIMGVKQDINNIISACKLPAMIVQMIISELSTSITNQTNQILEKENKEFQESQSEEKVDAEIVEEGEM